MLTKDEARKLKEELEHILADSSLPHTATDLLIDQYTKPESEILEDPELAAAISFKDAGGHTLIGLYPGDTVDVSRHYDLVINHEGTFSRFEDVSQVRVEMAPLTAGQSFEMLKDRIRLLEHELQEARWAQGGYQNGR